MQLGAFSISLAVKDLQISKAFYEKLGFNVIGGDVSQNWLILRSAEHTIGLFEGMFEKNMLKSLDKIINFYVWKNVIRSCSFPDLGQWWAGFVPSWYYILVCTGIIIVHGK